MGSHIQHQCALLRGKSKIIVCTILFYINSIFFDPTVRFQHARCHSELELRHQSLAAYACLWACTQTVRNPLDIRTERCLAWLLSGLLPYICHWCVNGDGSTYCTSHVPASLPEHTIYAHVLRHSYLHHHTHRDGLRNIPICSAWIYGRSIVIHS